MTAPAVAERFRVIDPESVLFGIDGDARLDVLAQVAARLWERTGLAAQRIYGAFEEDALSGCSRSVNGALLAVGRVKEAEAALWMAVRLRDPVPLGDGEEGVDLVFAVVGSSTDPMLPQMLRCFDRVMRDRPALDGLRGATSKNWFCAELAWALERACCPSAISAE